MPVLLLLSLCLETSLLCAAEPPRVEHIGLIAPDILGVTIAAGRVEYGRQVPYVRQSSDSWNPADLHRFVARDGKIIGTLVGKDTNLLCTLDTVLGERLDAAWADSAGSYLLKSKDDPSYTSGQPPRAVHRKTKPSDLAMVGPYQFDSPTETVVYLQLPSRLKPGCEYALVFNGALPSRRFVFEEARLRSEAVHVSQIGFRPDDPVKMRFPVLLDGQRRRLGYYEGLPFAVVEDATGKASSRGPRLSPRLPRTRPRMPTTRTTTAPMSSRWTSRRCPSPGSTASASRRSAARIPFEIADDVWRKAFVVSARGLLPPAQRHQAGRALHFLSTPAPVSSR